MEEIKQIHNGSVVWFNAPKGIGFIAWNLNGIPQKDMFVHYSDISMPGYKTLNKDDKVSFEIGVNFHGQPKACKVEILK